MKKSNISDQVLLNDDSQAFISKYAQHMLKYHTGKNPWTCFEKNPKGDLHYILDEFEAEKTGAEADVNSRRSQAAQTLGEIFSDEEEEPASQETTIHESSNEVQTSNTDEVFSFDLPDISVFKHAWKRDDNLLRFMGLQREPLLQRLFLTIAPLCDPLTQPMESDRHIFSVELISDIAIALNSPHKSAVGSQFELALNIFQIIERSLILLNCNDEIKLRSFNNSDLKVDWRLKLHEWTPLKFLKNQDIILLYEVIIICIYTIYKLFDTADLCLNPFLQQLLRLWKIFTNVLLLSLEIDRRIETENKIEKTPDIIKTVIKGSSAIRYILAAMLNDDIDNRYHDLNHVNIIDFMSTFARKNGNGSLVADVRWYIGSMLALSFELNEVIEILIDLEPNDKYDEDVKYIFDYEFDDYNHEFSEEELQEYKDNGFIIYQDEEDNFHRLVPQRCTCTFPPELEDDEDELNENAIDDEHDHEDGDDDEDEEDDGRPVKAIRSDSIEFDEYGRDWRDIPRDTNVEFNAALNLDNKEVYSWDELLPIFNEMTERPINDKTGKKIIFTIARAIKFNDESIVEKIYEFFQYDSNFELMINLNPELCYSMLDELFMTKGFRRVLIWFLTHLKISQSLINYIYQALTELRGSKSKKFPFSRMGPLKLSEIEKSMLLHEFFNNTIIQLNNNMNGQHGSNEKILKFICLMIKNLISKDILDLVEYKFEISNLLINYIGVIPEAKEIFFQINHIKDGEEHDQESIMEEYKDYQKHQIPTDEDYEDLDKSKKSTQISIPAPSSSTFKFKKFNPALKNNLNNILNIFDNGESESLIFQPFLELIKSQPSDVTPSPNKPVKKEVSQEIEDDEEGTERFVKGEILPSLRHFAQERSHEIFEETNTEN